jgi:hypothetical protein
MTSPGPELDDPDGTVGPQGTRERTRALKAMPPSLQGSAPGCLVAVVVYVLACLGLFRATRNWLWLALALPAVALLASIAFHWIRGLLLLSRSRRALAARGIRCLVVYSPSPSWEAHVRDRWLARLGDRATVLNWSERASWPASLEARLFEHFVAGPEVNFNPAVLVLRGLRQPQVYRFYYAFQEASHGRTRYLEALEEEMFRELGA